MKILLVERDVSLLETIKDICNEEGFTAVTASDCFEAKKHLVSGFKPSLILCDEFLPTCQGNNFRTELLSHPEWRDIPFILMLAIKPMNGKHEKGTLYKPFSMEDLLSLLRQVKPS